MLFLSGKLLMLFVFLEAPVLRPRLAAPAKLPVAADFAGSFTPR
jgi:hypothetical protein